MPARRQGLVFFQVSHTIHWSKMEEKLRLAVESLITDIDKKHLRVLRKEGFLCSAKCCDSAPTHENLETCVQGCQKKVAGAEEQLGTELQNFQGRLQRCVLACKDSVESEAAPNMDAALQAKLQEKVDKCALKCVNDQIASLGPMKVRLDSALGKLH